MAGVLRSSVACGLACSVAGWFLAASAWGAEPVAGASSAAQAAAERSPTDKAPAGKSLSGKELEQAVRGALRKAAQAKGAVDEALVRQLVELYRQVAADETIAKAQRDALRLALRSRLLRIGADLRANPAVAVAAKQGLASKQGGAAQHILAQQFGPGGAGAAGNLQQQATQNLGQDLADLIEETIAPATWEKVGGPGVIRFWAPGSALVVRQTGEVHGDVAGLLLDLK